MMLFVYTALGILSMLIPPSVLYFNFGIHEKHHTSFASVIGHYPFQLYFVIPAKAGIQGHSGFSNNYRCGTMMHGVATALQGALAEYV